jgi:hypothetical protein
MKVKVIWVQVLSICISFAKCSEECADAAEICLAENSGEYAGIIVEHEEEIEESDEVFVNEWIVISEQSEQVIANEDQNSINQSTSTGSFLSMINSLFGSMFLQNGPSTPTLPEFSELMPSDSQAAEIALYIDAHDCENATITAETSSVMSSDCQTVETAHCENVTLEKSKVISEINYDSNFINYLFGIEDQSVFEELFRTNLARIHSSVRNIKDYQIIAVKCVKMNSVTSLIDFMHISSYIIHGKHFEFHVNGPVSLIVASIYGCEDMLQFLISNRDHSCLRWIWSGFEGDYGCMNDFGNSPFSASIRLAALKTINSVNLGCMQILISAGLDVPANDFELLMSSAPSMNGEMFLGIIHNFSSIPDPVFKRILLLAIESKNHILAEALLRYCIKLDSRIVLEILPYALSCPSRTIFVEILPFIDGSLVTGDHLNIAIVNEKYDRFRDLVAIASKEVLIDAILSCINEPKYHHVVELILPSVTLDSNALSKILMVSVSCQNIDFVSMFIKKDNLTPASASKPFTKALESDNDIMVSIFLKRFPIAELVGPNNLTRLFDRLFNLKVWKSLKIYCEHAYDSNNFSKPNFMRSIFTTNQVEIARISLLKGTPFPKDELFRKIRNSKMRELANEMIGNDSSKKPSRPSKK